MSEVVCKDQFLKICETLRRGEVVAFPTETVFGVGVIYNDKDALEKLMEAKNRDYSKAVTLMVSQVEDIEKYAIVTPQAKKIIEAFMPGMITLIFNKKECVDDAMTNGKKTIGIRIPDDEFVLSLLKEVGPMLVTSANLSNHANTTCTKEVLEQLDGRIAMVVDGKTSSSQASSVVDVSNCEVKMLRVGKITEEDIMEVIK